MAAADGIIPAADIINVIGGACAGARNRRGLASCHYEAADYPRLVQALQARVGAPYPLTIITSLYIIGCSAM